MIYTLAFLSHGDPSTTAADTLASFREHVTPEPTTTVEYHDDEQLGFCKATGRLWSGAARRPGDYVFWLEHDFTFNRPVDLEQLAFLLRIRKDLAQMSLMRDAANDKEKQAGGLVASRPGEYRQRITSRGIGTAGSPSETLDWLEHRSYFTTNPSLMRAEFMRDLPWPTLGPACEGHFGRELVARGFSFGVWGEGDPWVTHTGERTGSGY